MKIFRVDDRLIHGQVVEGWIKNFNIPFVLIVSDIIEDNSMQKMIYQSIIPPKTELEFYSVENFINNWENIKKHDEMLVLFSNIKDLYKCRELINDEIYLNIGCIASRSHCIEVSDTVYLESEEIQWLNALASQWKIHIKKVPWENDVNFCGNK